MVFIAILLILLHLSRRPSIAQIPLYYQLLEAYHPSSLISSDTPPSPIKSALQTVPLVLGVSTTAIPQNIGGGQPLYTIAVLGDSMIDTLGPSLIPLKTALSQLYPSRSFRLLNYGYGASDIEYGLYRLNHDYDYQNSHYDSILAQKPDLIILESFAYNNFGNSTPGIDRHWLALGAITTTIRQLLPHTKILLATSIAPNSIIFANGIKDLHLSAVDKIEKTTTVKLYLQNLVNFATSQGFPLADTYHASLRGNDGLKEYIDTTGIHPSASGQKLFADTIAEAISRYKIIGQ